MAWWRVEKWAPIPPESKPNGLRMLSLFLSLSVTVALGSLFRVGNSPPEKVLFLFQLGDPDLVLFKHDPLEGAFQAADKPLGHPDKGQFRWTGMRKRGVSPHLCPPICIP
jgi:hypothetical protein